jgi:alkylation response protein AidB-like acyl-CoA dehydrogenase
MMDFDPGEEIGLLAATAREFAQRVLAPRLREHERERAIADEARSGYAQIGLAALELPEALGGAGLGALARAVVNEELGAADPGAALALDPLGPALYPLLELGGEAALAELALPLLEREGARAVLVSALDCELVWSGERLSGHVPWVPAERVDLLVALGPDWAVAVRDGIALAPLRGAGLRAAGAAELQLTGAPVLRGWRGAAAARSALARARVYTTSLLVGVLHRAAEYSREYALDRVAFGRPIAHHQALAFLIADLRSAVDVARLLLHEAAWALERGLPAGGAQVAAAFAEAIEISQRVGPGAVQILGGHGFMQDHPVEKYMRESRALGLWLGGLDAAREEAGVALCAGDPGLSHVDPEGLLDAEGRPWSF